MKVLHVIPSLSAAHGGPTRALALMERELAALGVTVHTVTSDDDGPGRRNGKPCGVPLAENGATRWYFRRQTGFYKASLPMARWLRRHAADYDLLHIHALFSFSSLAAVQAARRAGVPYILRPLGTLGTYGVTQRRPWLKRLSLAWLEGPALRDAAAVHFTSADEQREAQALGLPLRGVVIPLGVEPVPPASAAGVRQQFAALGDAPYLLYLSRLDPKKNLEGLLRAFAEVSPAFHGVRLLVAGDGDPAYLAQLQALAASLGLGDRVVWAGHVEGDLKASALAGAMAFVLPSFSENFGIAAAEALMAGLPCVLGQGVAIAGDVAAAGAGLVVEPEAASVAQGLRRLLGDEAARVAMGAAASALARERYSARAMGLALLSLYERVAPPRAVS
jgi:glycosyltransferase involved in cell wall biosynthesis